MLTWTNERHVAQVTVWDLVEDARIVARAGHHRVGREVGGVPVGLHWFWRLDRRAIFWTDDRASAERAVVRATEDPRLLERYRHLALWIGLEWAYDISDVHRVAGALPIEFPGTPAGARERIAGAGDQLERMVPVVMHAAAAKWRELLRVPVENRPFPTDKG